MGSLRSFYVRDCFCRKGRRQQSKPQSVQALPFTNLKKTFVKKEHALVRVVRRLVGQIHQTLLLLFRKSSNYW